MTTPRIVSLTALAASLIVVVMTITQANSLSPASETADRCMDPVGSTISDCAFNDFGVVRSGLGR